jgi:hypothetical protein
VSAEGSAFEVAGVPEELPDEEQQRIRRWAERERPDLVKLGLRRLWEEWRDSARARGGYIENAAAAFTAYLKELR